MSVQSLLIHANCGCGAAIPVEAIVPITCRDCKRTLELDYGGLWPRLFYYAHSEGHLRAERCPPLIGSIDIGRVECPSCNKPIDEELVATALRTKTRSVACPNCNAAVSVRQLKEVLNQYLDRDGFALNGDKLALVGEHFVIEPHASGAGGSVSSTSPVNIPCSACGAPLTADGSTRIPNCTFCGVRNYLSDELWLALHPAARARPFYLWESPLWDGRPTRKLTLAVPESSEPKKELGYWEQRRWEAKWDREHSLRSPISTLFSPSEWEEGTQRALRIGLVAIATATPVGFGVSGGTGVGAGVGFAVGFAILMIAYLIRG